MSIDLHDKALNLLNMLANSVHDRNYNVSILFFSSVEINLVEDWLRYFVIEVQGKHVE